VLNKGCTKCYSIAEGKKNKPHLEGKRRKKEKKSIDAEKND